MNSASTTIMIHIRPLPEGVWLATSDDLPGLVVEAGSREEAIDLSKTIAIDLLEEGGWGKDRQDPTIAYVFADAA